MRVGLGCDGSASTDHASMSLEARTALLLGRYRNGPASMSARDALDAATIGGADALQRPDLGRLQPGSRADITVFEFDRPHSGQVIDPIQTMMLTGHGRDFATVVIDGRFVMENRAIPGQDEAADNIRAQKQFEGVMARYPERTLGHPPMSEIFSSSYAVERSEASA